MYVEELECTQSQWLYSNRTHSWQDNFLIEMLQIVLSWSYADCGLL